MSVADDRAERLQSSLDRLAAGEPPREVLASLADDPELEKDLELVVQLAAALPSEPRPATRGAQQAALQQLVGRRTQSGDLLMPSRWSRRLSRLVGVAAALIVLMWSAAIVSADSLPGDSLYAVKRASEQTRLTFALSPAARARIYLEIADNRLYEVRALVDRGLPVPAGVVENLIAAQTAARVHAAESGDPDLVQEAELSIEETADSVGELLPAVEPASREVLERASVDLREGLPSATPSPSPEGSSAEVRPVDVSATSEPTGEPDEAFTPLPGPATWTPTLPIDLLPTATIISTATSVDNEPVPSTAVPTPQPPTSTAAATAEPTIPNWRESARATDLAREQTQTAEAQTQEAQPTRTPRPPWHRQGADPTETPDPGPYATAQPEPTALESPPPAVEP